MAVTFWDIENRETLKQHIGYFRIIEMAFDPMGQMFAVSEGAYKAKVQVYDFQSGAGWESDENCYGFAFSPDGEMITVTCAASGTSKIFLLDAANGDHLREFTGTQSVGAISTDGKLLASISVHNTMIQIWDIDNDSAETPRNVFRTQGESVTSVEFGIDGQVLAVIAEGYEETSNSESKWRNWLQLWDVDRGELLSTIDNAAWDGSFSPDGRYLTVGHPDGTVSFWGIK
jgi:WD40 repeat protein